MRTLLLALAALTCSASAHDAHHGKPGAKDAHTGGIRTAQEALQYLVMVKETLGAAWLTPEWFRFGASSLLTDVNMQIAKMADGTYQRVEDFPLP